MKNLGRTIGYCLILAILVQACKTDQEKTTTAPVAVSAQDNSMSAKQPPALQHTALDTGSAAYHFLKQLVMGESPDGRYKELNLDSLPFSIALEDEGMPYSVYYSIVAREDLNGDRIPDYIIRRESEGMLGGSAQTNGQLDYYIMKDSLQYGQHHSILTYAPFSYNIISDYRFDKGILTVSLSKNFRNYPDANETAPRDFHFVYKEGNLYETSYLTNCVLGGRKDKSIFNNGPVTVIRKRSIDEHNFTETLEEKMSAGDTSITACLAGCDNTELYFEVGMKHSNMDTSSALAKKELLLTVLRSLAGSTRFGTELTRLAQFYEANDYREGGTDADDRLSGTNWIQRRSDGTLLVRIGIAITENEKQGDNWEVLNRVK
ncbi:hypothetical protein [Niabella beijingensis]|uniref:hypothetical protein n=1 Tax=Niabella beijingensis TaxID=2872700 RepID=UPI001CBE558E|nr:hypothetical protein [Niabella beijingensis]MBZ4187990.1 hypothetical protein [Niabella beijingensis]